MNSNRWVLVLALAFAPAEAQEIIGTPLNAPYATMLGWLFSPASDKVIMPGWLEAELLRHAAPEHKEFARSVKVTLLGRNAAAPCLSMKSFAQSGTTDDGRPEISFCIRTLQYHEQLSRTWSYLAMHETFQDKHYDVRVRRLERYVGYVYRQVALDRDIATDPEKFAQFCTVEFFILIDALGDYRNECPPAAVAKYSTIFHRFFWNADFLPDRMLEDQSPTKRQEAAYNFANATMSTDWRGHWRSALLHEFGHLVACHQGSFRHLKCQGKPGEGMPSHDDAKEVEADGYVIRRVLASNNDDPEKILSTLSTLMMYNFTRIALNRGLAVQKGRIEEHQAQYKKIFRKAFSDKELRENFRKIDPDVLKKLDDLLK